LLAVLSASSRGTDPVAIDAGAAQAIA